MRVLSVLSCSSCVELSELCVCVLSCAHNFKSSELSWDRPVSLIWDLDISSASIKAGRKKDFANSGARQGIVFFNLKIV